MVLLVPRHPLRRRLGDGGRARRAHRGQAAGRPQALGRPRRPRTSLRRRLSRRGLVRTAGVASVAAVLLTAGGTVPWLRKVSVFSAASGDGPQDLPVNRVPARPGSRPGDRPDVPPRVVYADQSTALTRSDLLAMPQTTAGLPIACVEGWSAHGDVDRRPAARPARPRRGAAPGRRVTVSSLQERGRVPGHPPAGPVRRRRPHPARARSRRRGAVDRPRLPGPADRAEPAGRAADQVGQPAGGGGVRTRLLARALSASRSRRTAPGCSSRRT